MNVAMIIRPGSYSTPGGDVVQATQTAKHLRKKGISVDIYLADDSIKYEKYDLLHFFNIIRPANILKHINNLKIPFAVSPIFVDYSEFDKKYRKGFAGNLANIFSADQMEYLKSVARAAKGTETLASKKYMLQGHKKSVKKIISRAAMLLPNSDSEYLRLVAKYEIEKDHITVPNGVDKDVFSNVPGNSDRNGVICVARIEGIKNQLNLIKGLNNTGYRLKIIGQAAPNHQKYFKECKAAAGDNITFTGQLPQNELLEIYKESKVHILPSRFETTGLSSLEAAAMGCNIVITDKGDTREYFKNYAFYCDPEDPGSIYNAVVKAYTTPANPELSEYILKNFTWSKAAGKTLEAYHKILS